MMSLMVPVWIVIIQLSAGNLSVVTENFQERNVIARKERLEALSCLSGAISKLLNARRAGTNKVYERIWSKFIDYISTTVGSCSDPRIQDILGFLQSGLDLSLSVSSLRVQVSAISAFSGIAWARHPLI